MAMGIRIRLAGTLAAMTVLIALLALFNLHTSQKTVDALNELRQSAIAPAYHLSTLARSLVRHRLAMSRLMADPRDGEAAQRRNDIATEESQLQRSMESLSALRTSNPQLVEPLRKLQVGLDTFRATSRQAMTLLEADKLPQARATYDGDVTTAGRTLRKQIDTEIEALDDRTTADMQRRDATLSQQRQIVIAVLLVLVLAAAWIGWRLLQDIMVPVQRMRETLASIGQGDLTARVATHRNDELGDLASSVNQMGTLLQDAAALAAQSSERQERETAQLRAGVDQLRQLTEAAASGNLAHKAGAVDGEEMQELAGSVDAMVGGLRQLVSDLQTSMLQIRGCTTDLTASVRDNETTLAEQAASSTEVAATSTEMAQNADELATIMRRVSDTNESAMQRAEQGRESLQRLDSTMAQILGASGDISNALGALATKSADITSVVTAITRVADQTNLLSLNAAIEAEKAGEYGQGFSVIAGEIRRLSDQTSDAAGNIEQIVREMHTALSASVLSMDRFNDQVRRNVDDVGTLGGVLTGVIESVEALAPRVESASQSMRAQAEGAGQINEAIRQIHDSITHAHRSMRTTTEATSALNAVAQQLQLGISRFRLA